MTPDTVEFRTAMRGLRRRRWFLWGLILVYIPVIWTSLALTRSDRATGWVFAAWLVLVCVAVMRAAFAKCPRCGNYFHMNGFVPLYLRRCLHCGLHITENAPSDDAEAEQP